MKNLVTGILITLMFQNSLFGQSESYKITLAPFSSKEYDEFSPVYFKNGIVFCTNRSPKLVFNYTGSKDKGQFKIYYAESPSKANWRNARLFSKSLTTILNDGPVTFNSSQDTIYYSRNMDISAKLSDISNSRNKLGIFNAVWDGREWTKMRELRISNEWYNITTPSLSPDGKKLYFASDKPGGYGGSDLFYSEWKSDYWSDPVNLGPVINTSGNETFPFLSPSGDLYFSSDGQPGLGGKDIFFSQYADTSWLTPVRLDPPINTNFDDFGIVTDTLMNEGYFSSNRNGNIDIFQFKTIFPQVFFNNIQRENQYCFTFDDNGSMIIDSTFLKSRWNFGDGKSSGKTIASHCYSGPGIYDIKLDLLDRNTGKFFFTKLSYKLNLHDTEQPYINSSDVAVKGDVMEFDGRKTNLPGFEILTYSWNFGDHDRASGELVRHSYKNNGEYLVNLTLTLKSVLNHKIQKKGVSKKILILNDIQEKEAFLAKRVPAKATFTDVRNNGNVRIVSQQSAETESQKEAVFAVELLSSKSKIDFKSSIFMNLPKKYTLKERYNQEEGIYSYVIDEQMNLMATYPAYREMIELGFKDARTIVIVLKEPSEKELYSIVKMYGSAAETYFDNSEKLTSPAYIMLDQIVRLMNKYPQIKIEVSVHSDNMGPEGKNITLTKSRSELIVNYLINRGITESRLISKGFGGSKPIGPNSSEYDRRLNRRIEFKII